jgi:hypothetical protein
MALAEVTAEVRRFLPRARLVQQLIISRAIMHAYKQNIIREREESDKSAAAQVVHMHIQRIRC